MEDISLVDRLRAMGDSAYARGCDLARGDLCLGAEHKIETGKFTVENLKAHEEVRTAFGRSDAYYYAAKVVAESIQPSPETK